MLHRRHSRGGFTLVELLVVIGIIAILISILLPALSLACRHAQDVICESNFRQFGMAIQIYANNSNGFLPSKGPDGSKASDSFGNTAGSLNGVKGYDDDTLWFNAIPPLIDNKTYYQILLDEYNSKGSNAPPNWENNKSIFTCPLMGPPGISSLDTGEVPPTMDYYLLFGVDSTKTIKSLSGLAPAGQFHSAMVYVWNSKLQTSFKLPLNSTNPDFSHELPNVKLENCQPASEVVLMTEKLANCQEYLDKDLQNWNNDYPSFYKTTGKIDSIHGYNSNIGQTKADWTRFTTRHHGGGFLLFADGHVQWYGWSGVQYHGSPSWPLSSGYDPSQSDANQYGEIVWSIAGPVNSN